MYLNRSALIDPPIWFKGHFGRTIPHEREHKDENDRGGASNDQRDTPPAEVLKQPGKERQKKELSSGVGGGQPAQNKPPVFIEPSICNYGCKDKCGNSRTRSNAHTPEEDKLPLRFHSRC